MAGRRPRAPVRRDPARCGDARRRRVVMISGPGPSSPPPDAAPPEPPTLIEAIIPIASLIVLIGMGYYLFGADGASGPNQIALVFATMIAVFIGWRRGHTLDALREAAVASVASGLGAIFILFAVGALIGTWAMSGTL